MCLIIVKQKDVELPCDSHITIANSNNDDGIGVAVKFADKTRVLIKKDFKTVGNFIDWMKANVKKEDSMIIHFRWATSGKNDPGNRHPFPITRNKELLRKTELWCSWAVTHNGVLSDYSGHKKYSDTQKFTLDILASHVVKENLKDKTIQKMLTDFIGSDKLALLNEDGTIIKIGNFNKDTDGCFYSNDTYKQARITYDYSQYRGYGGHAYFSQGNLMRNQQSSLGNDIIDNSPGEVEDSPIVSKGTIFYDHCDGCGKKKKLLEVDSSHFEGETFFLCKSCRKKYKKGKLDKLDEQLGNGIESAEEMKQCDSCLTQHPMGEILKHGDMFYCVDCCEDWQSATNSFGKKLENQSALEQLNLENEGGCYCG